MSESENMNKYINKSEKDISEKIANIKENSNKIRKKRSNGNRKKSDQSDQDELILGMTGSRNGMSDLCKTKLRQFLRKNNIIECHHGDCVGADEEFHDIAQEENIKIVVHPPKYTSYRAFCIGNTVLPPHDYLFRNRQIVDSSDMLIAFPPTIKELIQSGTWYTIRYARTKNKKILILHSDGSYIKENW